MFFHMIQKVGATCIFRHVIETPCLRKVIRIERERPEVQNFHPPCGVWFSTYQVSMGLLRSRSESKITLGNLSAL
jgi:hypothetical protein